MTSQLLQLSTEAPFQCLPLTAHLERFVQVHGERDGAVVVSTHHHHSCDRKRTGGEALMDLQQYRQLAPPTAAWKHNDLGCDRDSR